VFPIGKSKLSLREIAKYWAREIQPPASRNELLQELEAAWWLGQIRGDSARLDVLKRMFKAMHDRDDADVVFFVEEAGEPQMEQLSDGLIAVDLRPCISVPSKDVSTWDESNCEDAFQALAQTSSTESYPEMTPTLAWIELTFEEFTNWLSARGYAKTKFWKPLPATNQLKRAKRGRPADYDWTGVKRRLAAYVDKNGSVENFGELLQKCADFASELHEHKKTPDDSTIRKAIQVNALDVAAGLTSGK
jgi:hypothetical protein